MNTPVCSPRVAVGALIFDASGRVLLVKRGRSPSRGRWSIPGGKVDWGETLQEAVRREVVEETGLVLGTLRFFELFERISREHHYVIVDFVGVVGAATAPVAGDDAQDAGWFDRKSWQNLSLTDGLAEVLPRAWRWCEENRG